MQEFVFQAVLVLVPLILSLTVHEFAHALVADRLGDETPRLLGRLTLDPRSHADLVGTFLVPLAVLYAQLPFFFGWARPVPTNPLRLTRRLSLASAMLLVALAGPLANLLLALAAVGGYALWMGLTDGTMPEMAFFLFSTMAWLNLLLAIFNMIPIPPLDGSRLVFWLLPRGSERIERAFRVVAPVLFLVLVLRGGGLIGPLVGQVVTGLDWITQGQTSQLVQGFLQPGEPGPG